MSGEDDTKAILKRRARYVAMALAGVGTATQAACGPCLSPTVDAGDLHADADRDASFDAGLDAAEEIDAASPDDARAEADADGDAP